MGWVFLQGQRSSTIDQHLCFSFSSALFLARSAMSAWLGDQVLVLVLLPHCVPNWAELPKGSVATWMPFHGMVPVGLHFHWMRSQGRYSGSANRAVTSTSKSYYSLLQEKGDTSQVGWRGCLPETCFTLFPCCIFFCQPLRCGLQWVSCVVSMDGRPLRSCCAGVFQKVLLFIET